MIYSKINQEIQMDPFRANTNLVKTFKRSENFFMVHIKAESKVSGQLIWLQSNMIHHWAAHPEVTGTRKVLEQEVRKVKTQSESTRVKQNAVVNLDIDAQETEGHVSIQLCLTVSKARSSPSVDVLICSPWPHHNVYVLQWLRAVFEKEKVAKVWLHCRYSHSSWRLTNTTSNTTHKIS